MTAAAPSFNFEAFAAVIVPSFSKAGLILDIFSNFARPGYSSFNIDIFFELVIGIISSVK